MYLTVNCYHTLYKSFLYYSAASRAFVKVNIVTINKYNKPACCREYFREPLARKGRARSYIYIYYIHTRTYYNII